MCRIQRSNWSRLDSNQPSCWDPSFSETAFLVGLRAANAVPTIQCGVLDNNSNDFVTADEWCRFEMQVEVGHTTSVEASWQVVSCWIRGGGSITFPVGCVVSGSGAGGVRTNGCSVRLW